MAAGQALRSAAPHQLKDVAREVPCDSCASKRVRPRPADHGLATLHPVHPAPSPAGTVPTYRSLAGQASGSQDPVGRARRRPGIPVTMPSAGPVGHVQYREDVHLPVLLPDLDRNGGGLPVVDAGSRRILPPRGRGPPGVPS